VPYIIVYLSARISQKTACLNVTKFSVHVTVAVARPFSADIAIC